MHSISDLTTFCRKTTGDVPAKLVGASTTVIGSKMYLFGGRLVTERRMVSDLYVFDLEKFHWEKIPPLSDEDIPRARYFHSADTWNNQLVVFGGMSNKFDSTNPEDLCVLNDVRFFDIVSRRWLPATSTNQFSDSTDPLVPRARYAHLSSVTADRLFIIGGQDFFNVWLDDIHVYDLASKAWVQRRDYPRHCGTYRSVAVSGEMVVRLPQEEREDLRNTSLLGPAGSRFKTPMTPPTQGDISSSDSLIHLPYSTTPTPEHPSDIYLYSNYNFTDVKRELELFSPLPDSDFTIHDRSSSMTGSSFPPGLRFPTGAILGTHLIIAGTYLAHSFQSFSIWALDLLNMTWSRIDPGTAVSSGSWFRGCLWAQANKFIIFGNRNGNLVEDYNRRLLSWDHVAVVDLEAFGVFQPPPPVLDISMQELGLAALEENLLTDFEILCDDGRKIQCSRQVLEERWPWFREERQKFLRLALKTLETLPASPRQTPLPEIQEGSSKDDRPDPRLTPRCFQLSEPYPITMALVQYFYCQALITPLQHAPAVLSQLLVLSSNYGITHLESLVKFAMHRALSNSTSVGVYEVATLCSCRSLQIRALKTVMSYSQKRPSGRSRQDRDNGGRPPDTNGSGNSRMGGGGPSSPASSRPRGTSDAHWRGQPDYSNTNGGRGFSTRPAPQLQDSGTTARMLALAEVLSLPPRSPLASQSFSSPSIPDTPIIPRSLHRQQDSTVSTIVGEDIIEVADLHSTSVPPSQVDRKDFTESLFGNHAIRRRQVPLLATQSSTEIPYLTTPRPATAQLGSQSSSTASQPSSSNEWLVTDAQTASTNNGFNSPHHTRLRRTSIGTSDSESPSLISPSSYCPSNENLSPCLPLTPTIPYADEQSEITQLARIEERLSESPYVSVDSLQDSWLGTLAEEPVKLTTRRGEVAKSTSSKSQYSTAPSSFSTQSAISATRKPAEGVSSPSVSLFSLFSPKKEKFQAKPQTNLSSSTSHDDFASSKSILLLDKKAIKAGERARKKAEHKARVEALAMELKRRACERDTALEIQKMNFVERRRAGASREDAVMYGGFVF